MPDAVDPISHVRHLPIIEQMKYSQARYVWPRRAEMVEFVHDGARIKVTWVKWWELKHKEDYHQYVETMKKLHATHQA